EATGLPAWAPFEISPPAVTPPGPVQRPFSLTPPSYFRDDGVIVTVTPPSGLSDAGIASILSELETRMARGSKYVLVFDLSGGGTPTPVQRKLLAAHMQKNKALIGRWVHALGVVVPSSIVRGMLTAIFWLEAPPVPCQMFGTADEAAFWARGQARTLQAP